MTQLLYAPTSPYAQTPQLTKYVSYLDFWRAIVIPSNLSDLEYPVEHKYTHRPDLLSFDCYQTDKYWWVFALRNPNIIIDPIYDLVAGIIIYIPPKSSLPSGNST